MNFQFLGVFEKVPKATISFVMSVRMSVFSHGRNRLPLNGFHEIWYWNTLLKSIEKIKFNEDLTRITSTSHKDRNIFFVISRSFLLIIRNISVVEKIKPHILCSITFFPREPCRLSDNVEKYCRAGQDKNNNIALAHSTLDT
jgi:hypothetical protein